MAKNKNILPDSQVEKILKGIFVGDVSPWELSEELYLGIANKLKAGLYEGFGGTLASFEGPPLELLSALRENVYMFSAAKSFQQTLEMSDAITDGDRVLSWDEYKQVAADIYAKHNGGDYLQADEKAGYLQTEYETAVTQGQNVNRWQQITAQKHILPYLQKNVVEDENTCEICGPCRNLVAPVNDPIWDTMAGELHFRCRCFEDQLDIEDGEALYNPEESEKLYKSQSELMKPMFKHNAFKSKQIFSKDSPYFSVPKEYQDFAKENFGLPIPETDE